MNRLSREKRAAIIRCLVEGNSLRGTSRLTGAALNTVTKLLVDVGAACSEYQDKTLRNLTTQRVECDEIWSYVGTREKNLPRELQGVFGLGDVWTFVAIDADTKLVPSWLIGPRYQDTASLFMQDLATRLANRVQLTTDGHKMYLTAVPGAFGRNVDFAQLVKEYAVSYGDLGERTGTVECTGSHDKVVSGSPDPDRISTSYIERQNLSMRMGMRRFTRSTNAFSKKVQNHAAAIALHFMYMNFARPHRSLANPYPRTPAMAAGLAAHVWTCEEIAALLG
jgi:IS1 family transposase